MVTEVVDGTPDVVFRKVVAAALEQVRSFALFGVEVSVAVCGWCMNKRNY